MPRIFDNIHLRLADGLQQVMHDAVACAFCVGYFNLRGWDTLATYVEKLPGGDETRACRLLVGMHRLPEEEMRLLYRASRDTTMLDGAARRALLHRFVQSFKEQIEFGVPSDAAERTLRQIARQLRQRKLYVKAFLKHPLHAKLYLVERGDNITPLIGFVGSSNLTLAGLSQQGELNVDVVEQDAAQKLLQWFNERWDDPSAIDLTDQLAEIIETSWAREELVRPYLVYLKMAYHLCEEARQGERAFKMPRLFENVLLDFQAAAVSLAVHTLYRRGGVLLGDVVGLGKTLMATAIARILQEDADVNTLVICPPNLAPMWEWHLQQYQITGRVLSLGKVVAELPQMPRYRLLIIDESHNLRNREGKRYRAIRDYIDLNEPYVLLLTATPYNKEYTDLANQLRLIVDEDADLKVRPERFFQWWAAQGKNDADFIATYRTLPTTLRAFERSLFPDDWRDLMRLFLVRRTRQFIIRHYARYDAEKQRYYVTLNGQPKYFPVRQPKRVSFETRPDDPYTRLFSNQVVAVIENLKLPRYGLANYLRAGADADANDHEKSLLDNLTRAGRRLIGFSRTNLFKRLESSGYSFLLSVERHIVRNLVTLYALENNLPIPIGVQDAALMDTAISDADAEFLPDAETDADTPAEQLPPRLRTLNDYRACAERTYQNYRANEKRFYWLAPRFFTPELQQHLLEDAHALLEILNMAGEWNPDEDAKLDALHALLTRMHPDDKVLVFTQFADTALYLGEQLRTRGVDALAVAISGGEDPYTLARRFSPPQQQRLAPQPNRTARAYRHRCALRRAEPAGRPYRRQLRPAVGNHPPHPTRRARRPHRANQRHHPGLLLLPCRGRGVDHRLARAADCTLAREPRDYRHGRGLLRRGGRRGRLAPLPAPARPVYREGGRAGRRLRRRGHRPLQPRAPGVEQRVGGGPEGGARPAECRLRDPRLIPCRGARRRARPTPPARTCRNTRRRARPTLCRGAQPCAPTQRHRLPALPRRRGYPRAGGRARQPRLAVDGGDFPHRRVRARHAPAAPRPEPPRTRRPMRRNHPPRASPARRATRRPAQPATQTLRTTPTLPPTPHSAAQPVHQSATAHP
jgi:hypothetical protein